MTVQPFATTDPATGSTGSSNSTSSNNSNSPDNVTENQFLQLLVAQIQYQDPTNPTDSTAFVTQLAQFSSLEQLIGIRSDLDSEVQSSASGATGTSSTQGGN